MMKTLRNLLTLVALFAFTAAQAQFSATIEQEIWEDSYGDATLAEFSLSEVASALGTDTATLVAALDAESEAFYDAEDEDTYYASVATNDVRFQVLYNGGEQLYPQAGYGYTQGYYGGFWMLEDCTPCTWGDDGMAFYNYIGWDADEDVFYVAEGQAPGYFSVGDEVYANYLLTVNGSSVTFGITLSITAAEEVDITVDNVYANLTILDSIVVTVEEKPRTTYTADYVYIDFSQYVDKLGVTSSSLENYMEYYVYTRGYDYTNYVWTDTLNNDFTADEPGFWFAQTYDEMTDSYSNECYSADYSSESIFFIGTVAYDADSDTLYYYVGQYPGNCDENTSYWGTFYIVNGTNAVAVTTILSVTEEEQIDFSEMTLAGSEWQQVVIEAEYEDATMIEVDMDAICELLGIDSGDYSYYAYKSEGVLTNSSTANYGGFWFDIDGYVCSYGATGCAMYIEPYSTSYLNYLNVGQYVFTEIPEGDSLTCSLIVLGTTSYYQIDVNLKVEEAVVKDSVDIDEWTVVYTIEENIQLIADDDDYELQTYEMDLDAILNYTGLDALDSKCLYTWASAYTGGWDPSDLTNDYSCTPYPGFWMSADGTYNYEFSSSCAYGMTFTYATGEIIFYNYPGANATGDTYTSYFYIVNVENGNVVQLILDIEFVDEIVEITDAGEEDIIIVLDDDLVNDDGEYYTENDLSTMYSTLGMTSDEYDTGIWYVASSSSRYTQPDTWAIESTNFDADGYYTTDDAETVFSVVYDDVEGQFIASLFGEPIDDDVIYTTSFYYRYDYSRYYFNIVLATSEELATAISSLNSDSADEAEGIYDLSGRRLSNDVKSLAKGLYIINGKKVLIK